MKWGSVTCVTVLCTNLLTSQPTTGEVWQVATSTNLQTLLVPGRTLDSKGLGQKSNPTHEMLFSLPHGPVTNAAPSLTGQQEDISFDYLR